MKGPGDVRYGQVLGEVAADVGTDALDQIALRRVFEARGRDDPALPASKLPQNADQHLLQAAADHLLRAEGRILVWDEAGKAELTLVQLKGSLKLVDDLLETRLHGRGCGEEDEAPPDLSARRLCVLAIATSIDALAVGVSMAFMSVHILASAAVIGVVAFALSVTGGLVGRRLGCLFQRRAELTGGLVLIAIGVKILIEHLSGS